MRSTCLKISLIICALLIFLSLVAAQNDMIAAIPVENATEIAVNSTTGLVYAVGGNLYVIDGYTNTLITTVPLGAGSFSMAINELTNRVYIADVLSGVRVIDGSDQSEITTIPFAGVIGVAVNPATNRIYATEMTPGKIHVINGDDNTIIDTLTLAVEPTEIAVNAATNRIYVVDQTLFSVLVLDGETHTLITTIPVGTSNPNEIGINEATNQIYLSLPTAGTYVGELVEIDGDANTITRRTPVPYAPNGLAVNTSVNRVYVGGAGSSQNEGGAFTIDNGALVDTLAIRKVVYDLAADSSTGRVYAVTVAVAPPPTLPGGSDNLMALSANGGDRVDVIQDEATQLLEAPLINLFTTRQPTLTWKSWSSSTGYWLQVDNNPAFSSPEFDNPNLTVDDIAVTITSPLNDGRYYWRVRARYANNQWSDWSSVERFVVRG